MSYRASFRLKNTTATKTHRIAAGVVDKASRIVLDLVPPEIRNSRIIRLCLALWQFVTKRLAVLVNQLKGRTKGPEVIDGLCVIAADQHTLSTIAEQVREATGGFYTVEEHLVTNRKAVAELPIYNRAICCVRNAERNISFNNQGALEPEADLGFRAFDRMEAYTGDKSGVLLLMFDHAESQGISELHSMAGITPSPRLSDTAQVGRFLTVYRQLSRNQKEFISKWATL
ncbi:PREDICTED: uncharacterized protein LOC109484109 [Branchiostoma belcheri]|uniref:Uncharacterized protein LOC109484109 n=1 Tax=Branchiostoma belcheri TaxID=7741 RepID=A0A6P4ZNY7_BRABE|nr:PREDICTED: uncharacterized protein LOC109484109 [Branchiostoma belcheri]